MALHLKLNLNAGGGWQSRGCRLSILVKCGCCSLRICRCFTDLWVSEIYVIPNCSIRFCHNPSPFHCALCLRLYSGGRGGSAASMNLTFNFTFSADKKYQHTQCLFLQTKLHFMILINQLSYLCVCVCVCPFSRKTNTPCYIPTAYYRAQQRQIQ